MKIWLHDCLKCKHVYSGYIPNSNILVNWYKCESNNIGGSLIGRYGDEPHEYWSMPIVVLEEIKKQKAMMETDELFDYGEGSSIMIQALELV